MNSLAHARKQIIYNPTRMDEYIPIIDLTNNAAISVIGYMFLFHVGLWIFYLSVAALLSMHEWNFYSHACKRRPMGAKNCKKCNRRI